MKRIPISLTIALLAAAGAPGGYSQDRQALPEGFVYLDEAIPGIVIELKYTTDDNFVGQPIDGYEHGHAILSEPAAAALAEVQAALQPFGLGLKVFDAYRPQRAVDHFVRWAGDLEDQRTKPDFYPDVAKEDLFEEGYIAARSGHSRGSTVDLTVVYRDEAGTVHELDMGSGYDFFGPISWPDSPRCYGPAARQPCAAAQCDDSPRIQPLSPGVVALHPLGRAVSGYLLRFSDLRALLLSCAIYEAAGKIQRPPAIRENPSR